MAALTRAAQRFLRDYAQNYAAVQHAAELARNAVDAVVRNTGVFAHPVVGRAKTPDSLRAKLRRKRYPRPSQQVTDTIGVRVITYYRDDVDRIAHRLAQEFDINTRKTTDKRLALGLRDFGYRSVHLIARLKPAQVLTPQHQPLRERWFEIQVRSILEHAWAEIEHEIVYKAGIKYPETVMRRFAALAGSLELLDGEFLGLRQARNQLIETYRDRYRQRSDLTPSFDAARLLGFLEAVRPEGRSWRQAAQQGVPFATGLDASCVDALKAAGLGTAASLQRLMHTARFRYAVRSFATAQGISPMEVSHLAVVVIAVTVKNARVIEPHFPEVMYDPAITALVRRRARR